MQLKRGEKVITVGSRAGGPRERKIKQGENKAGLTLFLRTLA
jgi:hypothetical protein